MNKSAVVQSTNTQEIEGTFTRKQLDTLKATIAKGTSEEQFHLFVQTCIRSGLDPLLQQIFCIVYGGNGKGNPTMSIQIAVEGIMALAKKHPQYKGFIAAEVRQNDHFKPKVHLGEVEHEPDVMNPGQTVAAYCIAYREGAPNMLVIVRRDQVDHLAKNQMWKDYFDDMIVKHAIKRAFKRQFGIEVAENEYVQSTPIEPYEPLERRDITPVNEGHTALSQPEVGKGTEMKSMHEKIKAAFIKLGIIDKQAMKEYTVEHMKQNGNEPTLQELTGLLKLMEMEIEAAESLAPLE